MKKAPWVIVSASVVAAVVGASLASLSPNDVKPVPEPSQSAPTAVVAPAAPLIASPLAPPAPKLDDFPHQPIAAIDEAKPGSEFWQFRQQLRQALQKRDAKFVQSILPPDGLTMGFGQKTAIADLNLTDPQASLWDTLEKAVALGCNQEDLRNPEVQTEGWVCPSLSSELRRQNSTLEAKLGDNYEFDHVMVVGNRVNVRSQPNKTSPVVGILSNEIVELDQATFKADLKQSPTPNLDPIDGWTPVRLPNGKQGYVYSRYAYFPLEYRAVFGKVNGNWRLLYMPGGD